MVRQTVLARPARVAATLLDLRLHAERAAEFIAGKTRASFLADQMTRDATMFCLVRIAEAVQRLPDAVREEFPDIKWSDLGRFTAERAYPMSEEDWGDAWEIATEAVPALLRFDTPSPPIEEDGSDEPQAAQGYLRIALPEAEIGEFCRRWRIAELAVFGSALREDFRPDSDVDFLVTFDPDATWSLLDHVHMQDELSTLVGRDVDLVERRAVETSPNWIRRRSILSSARPIYVRT